MSSGNVNGATSKMDNKIPNGAEAPHHAAEPTTEFNGAKTAVREVEQADIDHWHKHGYVIIEKLLSEEELMETHKDFRQYMPTWEEYKEREPMFLDLRGSGAGRGTPAGWVRENFPFKGEAINKVATHPFILKFLERIVGHSNLRMSHGSLVGKYAGRADYDQALHADYSNNTLAFPRKGVECIDIPAIIYHTDVTIDLGPTYVVSKEHTEHLISDGKRHHTRAEYPELYKLEKPALVPAGSVLIYSMRTMHRGSSMTAKEGLRWVQFTAFHTGGYDWLGSHTFNATGDSQEMRQFITNATPRERQLVGFPAADDPYWKDEEARLGVANRWPDMDMTPYGGRP